MEHTLLSNEIDQKLIVFESNPDFADNSRGFWEFIINNTDYRTFWIVNDEKVLKQMTNKGIACGLKGSSISNEMVERAQILFSSTFEFSYKKRIEQIHIAAWHGFPLKVIGFFDNAIGDESTFDNLRVITAQTDVIPVTSRFGQVITSGMFATDPRKAFVTGFPRNDLIFHNDGKSILESIIGEKYGESKLLLYMPTMRKGLKKEGAQFDDNIFNYPDYELNKLNKKLSDLNLLLFIKTHFEDDGKINKPVYSKLDRIVFLDNTLFTDNLITIYHILNAFDLLITDYSSIFVDYLLLNRPIIFSCPDMQDYASDRGFIADDPQYLMPGSIVKNQKELLDLLEHIFREGEDDSSTCRAQLKTIYHRYSDGNSSNRLFNEVTKLMSENNLPDISKREIYNLFNDKNFRLSQYGRKECIAELYYGDVRGFLETQKFQEKYFIYPYELTHEKMTFKCNSDTIHVRFDPNITGGVLLKNFKSWVNDKQFDAYLLINGTQHDNCLLFYDEDPQIIFKLDNINTKKDVCITVEFDCCSLSFLPDDVIKELGTNFNDIKMKEKLLNEELENIKDSKIWKLTHLAIKK